MNNRVLLHSLRLPQCFQELLLLLPWFWSRTLCCSPLNTIVLFPGQKMVWQKVFYMLTVLGERFWSKSQCRAWHAELNHCTNNTKSIHYLISDFLIFFFNLARSLFIKLIVLIMVRKHLTADTQMNFFVPKVAFLKVSLLFQGLRMYLWWYSLQRIHLFTN